MKTTLTYSTHMTLYIYTLRLLGLTTTIDLGCKELSDALEYVNCIFNDSTVFRADCVEKIHVIDSNTGELIAICEPDFEKDCQD